jgi:hypothetical protein
MLIQLIGECNVTDEKNALPLYYRFSIGLDRSLRKFGGERLYRQERTASIQSGLFGNGVSWFRSFPITTAK